MVRPGDEWRDLNRASATGKRFWRNLPVVGRPAQPVGAHEGRVQHRLDRLATLADRLAVPYMGGGERRARSCRLKQCLHPALGPFKIADLALELVEFRPQSPFRVVGSKL